MKKITSIALSLMLALLSNYSKSAPLVIPPFSSLCITEQSTGFNWESGKWVRTSFNAGQKIMVNKINIRENNEKSAREKQVMCDPERSFDNGFGEVLNKACYLVKEFGEKPLPYDAQMCVEVVENGILKDIECDAFTFHPDGGFIQHSKNNDISSNPKDGYKDSIYINVGMCSKVN
jgi:hypothetical protein